jgi:hypothetical protein
MVRRPDTRRTLIDQRKDRRGRTSAYRGLTTQPKPVSEDVTRHCWKVENSQLPGYPQTLPSRQYLSSWARASAGEDAAKRVTIEAAASAGKIILRIVCFPLTLK